MLVQIRRALTVSDQTRLRQLVAPRQGLLPIRILERQSGQRRRQPRYRARAPHVGSLAASVGLGNQRVAQTSWTPPPLRDQRWQRPEARLEHSGTAAAVQCRRERQRKRPAEWDRWHHGSALFPIRRAGHLMGSRLEPRHSQLRRRDSRQSVLNGIPSPLSRGRRVAQALAALAQRAAATGGTAPTTASLPSSGESFSSLGDLLDVEVPCAPSEAALYAELLVERPINLNRTSPGQINAHAPAESAAENWS